MTMTHQDQDAVAKQGFAGQISILMTKGAASAALFTTYREFHSIIHLQFLFNLLGLLEEELIDYPGASCKTPKYVIPVKVGTSACALSAYRAAEGSA